VQIEFVDDEFEGVREWVPPARLKVRWSGVDAYRAREARWDALLDGYPNDDCPEHYAVTYLYEEFVDESIAYEAYATRYGIIRIKDPVRFAALGGLEPHEVSAEPATFEDDGVLAVAWPTVERACRQLARDNGAEVLRHVAEETAEQEKKMMYGSHTRATRHSPASFIEPSFYIEQDDQPYNRPYQELLRQRCGEEHVQRRDELVRLRDEVFRIGQILDQAVDGLRAAGASSEVRRIQKLRDTRMG
jgi:hypothetical protein